jgi:hypothetical protein
MVIVYTLKRELVGSSEYHLQAMIRLRIIKISAVFLLRCSYIDIHPGKGYEGPDGE